MGTVGEHEVVGEAVPSVIADSLRGERVIFIGGLIGSGKSSLARGLSEKLGAYHFDIDIVKAEVYSTDPNYQHNVANGIPFSDELRTRMFSRVVEDLADLSEEHEEVVVDEMLAQKSTRQIIFDGAMRYFRARTIVWVTAPDAVIRERLTGEERDGHMLTNPLAMYESFKQRFEPITEADIIFENSAPLEESVEQLAAAIHYDTL